ncbi:MAG TPA: sugar porter family MFS transporter [Phycisphaerae bacterium]|nr:sugar porter family MFS transporter [Phycisphaerae bacterium]
MTHSNALELQEKGSVGYVYIVSAIAAVGGLLFGFDTAIISGAIGPVVERFQLNAWEEGWVVSCVLVGCIIGTGFAGSLSDWQGRKKVLIGTALFYAVSAILSAFPRTVSELVIARFIGGLAVGVSSMISPVYIAEISPARIRGRLVSLQQMAIVFGIVLAYFVSWLLVEIGDTNWRWMFGSEAFPALTLFVALFMVPESPRWLTKQGHSDRALGILARVGGAAHARRELAEIEESLAEEQGSIRELFMPGLRIALVVGITLAVLQQITGINTVIYYGPKILEKAGYDADSAQLWAQVLIGTTNCVCTILALWIIDKVGRKPLLLAGAAGMGLCLVGATFALPMTELSPNLKLIFVIGYVAFFAVGLGPTVWVIMAEIFPTKIRGRAMSIATLSLWVACFAVSQTFPKLIELFSENVFWIYASMCVVMIVFVGLVVPETKGKTLEQIERMWRRSLRLASLDEPLTGAPPAGEECAAGLSDGRAR